VASDERIEPSSLEGIRRVRSAGTLSPATLGRSVEELERFAEVGATGAVMQQLVAMVPTFRPVLRAPEAANGRHVLPPEVAAPAASVGEARGAA